MSFETHGESKKFVVEYDAWKAMRQRCNNPNNPRYADWGGRGIQVCERWNDYTNFLADMGRRPSAKHSLERIDNDKNYSPDNCKWATKHEQKLNQRNSVTIEFMDKRVSARELARKLRVRAETVRRWIREGLPI